MDNNPNVTYPPLAPDSAEPLGPSKNAVKHGAYLKEIILPGEDRSELEAMYAELRQELNPEGFSEESAVVQISQLQGSKRRLIASLAEAPSMRASSNEFRPTDVIYNGDGAGMPKFTKQLSKIAQEVGLKEDPLELRNKPEELTSAQRDVLKTIFHLANPSPTKTNSFNPLCDDFERFAKVLASLDSRIDRTMQRLICFKEYKRQYGAKVLSPT
jgi:hypothetical protein